MAKCRRCGREFTPQINGQQLCYDTCVPTSRFALSSKLNDEQRWKRDCVMFREDGINGPSCSGLVALYCGMGECRFYKKEGNDK